MSSLSVAGLAGCTSDSTTAPTDAPSSSALPVHNVSVAVTADRPLLTLPLQEDSGEAMHNVQGHPMTVAGEAWWSNDGLTPAPPVGVGRCWHTSESSADKAYVHLANTSTLLRRIPANGMTFEMWLRLDEANATQCLVHVGGYGKGWTVGVGSDQGLTLGGADTDASVPAPRLVGQWHHIVAAIDASGVGKVYVDAVKVGEGSVGPFSGSPSEVWLGTYHGQGAYVSGAWSRIALYGKVLPEDRIKAHYDAALSPEPGTVLPRRGVNPWFGGAEYYAKYNGADVLADSSRFPVAEWWMNAFPDQYDEESRYVSGGVVVNYDNEASDLRRNGLWAFRARGMDQAGGVGAETVGWMAEDEPDMDPAKEKALPGVLTKITDGRVVHVNYGIGVTVGSLPIKRVRSMVERPEIGQVSADLYSYCTTEAIKRQVGSAWDVAETSVRCAAVHARVVERMRGYLLTPRPVWGVVAVGHANVVADGDTGWASVPSADELEGSVWASIVGGASGIIFFPQTFPDGKKAPVWKASVSYQPGDTVQDPADEEQFWYCHTTPTKGVAPASVTDDSWLGWRPFAKGIRETTMFARGVSERVATLKQALQDLARVLNSKSEPTPQLNSKLIHRWFPHAPDTERLLVMQDIGSTKGTYRMVLPSVPVGQVEVVGENRSLDVTLVDGLAVVTDSFAHEYEHHWYSWATA